MTKNRILTAYFIGSRNVKTSALYQYDYGQMLRFNNLNLPATYEVHFSNTDNSGNTTTVLGDENGVLIPDTYLETGLPIFAWVFLHDTETDGETEYKVEIPVTKRAKPTNEQPSPVQQDIITQAIAALNNGTVQVVDAINSLDMKRVSSLDGTQLKQTGSGVVEIVGIPVYVDANEAVTRGLSDTGWYVFARINAPANITVDEAITIVTGAATATIVDGMNYVDIAVRFDTAALTQKVNVLWTAQISESFFFKAQDLAVRNLDYRTTFYVYDISPYATWEYTLTTDTKFISGSRYFTLSGGEYVEAKENVDWTAEQDVPENTYYKHSKLRFEGMTRNVTYRFDELVDCPQEYILPEIEDDEHGCWYEVRLRHAGSYSSTLIVPEGVKIAKEHTQAETAGLNMIDLHYSNVGGVKLWRFLNTHSTIPA